MERVNRLTIDDVAGQAVPESGTDRTECSDVADSHMPHSWYLQSMCPRWSEPMPGCQLGMSATRIRSSARYWGANPCNDLKINIASLNCMRSDAHSQWRLASVSVVWASKTGDESGSGVEHRLKVTTQGSRDSDQDGVPILQATQYQRCDQRLIDRRRDWTPDATKLAQRSETPGYCQLTCVRINEDAEIAHARWLSVHSLGYLPLYLFIMIRHTTVHYCILLVFFSSISFYTFKPKALVCRSDKWFKKTTDGRLCEITFMSSTAIGRCMQYRKCLFNNTCTVCMPLFFLCADGACEQYCVC